MWEDVGYYGQLLNFLAQPVILMGSWFTKALDYIHEISQRDFWKYDRQHLPPLGATGVPMTNCKCSFLLNNVTVCFSLPIATNNKNKRKLFIHLEV